MEFALIAGIMVMLLMGMFVYWRVLQAQQSLARATGDGARMVQQLVYGGMAGFNPTRPAEQANILQATIDVVNQSLAASGMPPGTAPTQIQIDWSTSQATLSVVYMLPPVLGQGLTVGNQTLGEPTRLEARSRVRLAPPARQEDPSMLTHLPCTRRPARGGKAAACSCSSPCWARCCS